MRILNNCCIFAENFRNNNHLKNGEISLYQKDFHKTMYAFQAVRISKKDNLLFPDRLEIDDYKVTYYKGRIFGYESTTIQRSSIGSVSVDAGILFATIYIETNGGQRTVL